MRPNHRNFLYAIAGAIAVMLLLPFLPANAGHTNSVLEADLDGRSEVGPSNRIAGDPNGRGEAYVFGIDEPEMARTTLCYLVIVEKIQDGKPGTDSPFMAHIHEGQPGENGPVVANLAFPEGGQSADCLNDGEPGKFPENPQTGEVTTVAEILANPGDYYVNVHNAEYPGGAVRGQLSAN